MEDGYPKKIGFDAQHKEQTSILEKDIQRVEDEVSELRGAFNHHLQIYANNGKELAALKQEVTDSRKTMSSGFRELKLIMKDNKDTYATKESVKPIKMLVFGAVGIMLTGLLSAVVALVVV